MSETWFRLGAYSFNPLITAVEVVKETAQQVVYISEGYGRKEERRSYKAGEFFKTFAEAKEYAIKCRKQEVESAKNNYSRAVQKLKDAEKFEP